MNLEPTGERMIQEHYKSSPEDFVIYLLHVAAYRYAERYSQGKRVLDYGCGTGYGSAHIARIAARVEAVDVADDAVSHARTNFASENLNFSVIDPQRPLPFADDSFDTVLSFQVLEHVHDVHAYLKETRRVLAPGGTLMLVTPDRSTRLLPCQRPWNRWHLHEYASTELENLMSRHFARIEMLGMGGAPEAIDIEVSRCNRIKWLTLPVTLPIMPDHWRVTALNAIHRWRGRAARGGGALDFPFDVDAIRIEQGISPSVNLVAIAA